MITLIQMAISCPKRYFISWFNNTAIICYKNILTDHAWLVYKLLYWSGIDQCNHLVSSITSDRFRCPGRRLADMWKLCGEILHDSKKNTVNRPSRWVSAKNMNNPNRFNAWGWVKPQQIQCMGVGKTPTNSTDSMDGGG